MSAVDTSHFPHTTDHLGISYPTIVDNNYWAVQLLKEVSV